MDETPRLGVRVWSGDVYEDVNLGIKWFDCGGATICTVSLHEVLVNLLRNTGIRIHSPQPCPMQIENSVKVLGMVSAQARRFGDNGS